MILNLLKSILKAFRRCQNPSWLEESSTTFVFAVYIYWSFPGDVEHFLLNFFASVEVHLLVRNNVSASNVHHKASVVRMMKFLTFGSYRFVWFRPLDQEIYLVIAKAQVIAHIGSDRRLLVDCSLIRTSWLPPTVFVESEKSSTFQLGTMIGIKSNLSSISECNCKWYSWGSNKIVNGNITYSNPIHLHHVGNRVGHHIFF